MPTIDYPDLFGRLGAVVKAIASLTAAQGTYRPLGAVAQAVFDAYDDREDLTDGLVPAWDATAQGLAAQVGNLKALADRTLADLRLTLNAPDDQPSTILARLAEDMVLNLQTVNASTVSAPAVAAVAGNTGTGTLVASKVDELGRDAEVGLTETVRLACAADRFTGGAPAGGERFSVTGWPEVDANAYGTRGNGNGDPVAVLNEGGGNLLSNGGFDDYAVANVPDGWTLATPAQAGVNVFKETTAGLAHSAAGVALRLQGNGSAATVALSQAVGGLSPRTRYVVGVFVRKGAGTFAAGSNLDVRVSGTGFAAVHLFNADPATLTTAYALKHLFFNVGDAVPADLALTIEWTSAGGVASTGQILLDDAAAGEPATFGGIRYALFRGAADFVVGDAFTADTAVTPGAFQGFFARFYETQLPSDAGGGETIADALAT